MLRNTVTTIFTGLMLAIAGCDNGSTDPLDNLPTSVEGTGVIRGTVQFVGTALAMKTFTATEACCAGDPPILEETVIVNSNNTLKNVFVYLEGGPKLNGKLQPMQTLDQVRCRYVPHVLGVQLNQPLKLRSSDPTMHNVHYVPGINPAKNYAMTQAGEEIQTKFTAGPEFVRMRCDVHPWMAAWVGVFENPFYAVTRDAGSFEIKGIPAGTYKLVAWHELFGRQERSVTISDAGAPLEIQFTVGKSG